MSWKLGRPVSLESFISPLSAGEAALGRETRGEINELSGEKCLAHETDTTICSIDSDEEEQLGLGLRLNLFASRVTTDTCDTFFKWWTHFPLYRHLDFTRTKAMGHLSPTSENTSRVSQVRRHRAFYDSATRLRSDKDKRRTRDRGVLKNIFDAYDPVAAEKRNEAAAWENDLPRLGHGSKVNKGRTFSNKDWEGKCRFLADRVKACGIDPIMRAIGDDVHREKVVKLCLDVLADGDGYEMGIRTDESHLYPEERRLEIDEAVRVLDNAGVSAEDLERFSGALHILDSLTSACLRPQDSLGCLACKAYMKKDRLVFVLPSVGKNSRALLRHANGMVVNHLKAAEATGVCVWCKKWGINALLREL